MQLLAVLEKEHLVVEGGFAEVAGEGVLEGSFDAVAVLGGSFVAKLVVLLELDVVAEFVTAEDADYWGDLADDDWDGTIDDGDNFLVI